jgi:hypothetical protein
MDRATATRARFGTRHVAFMLGDPSIQTGRALPKFESYGMLETTAFGGWKAKEAIEWLHDTAPGRNKPFAPQAALARERPKRPQKWPTAQPSISSISPLPVEEQECRKRALVKGPKEFREIREDLPKGKR